MGNHVQFVFHCSKCKSYYSKARIANLHYTNTHTANKSEYANVRELSSKLTIKF